MPEESITCATHIQKIGGTFENPGGDVERNYNKYDKKSRQTVVRDFFKGEKRDSVLDLGCSIGAWSEFLKLSGFKKRVGIDLSEERLEKARKREYTEVYLMSGTDTGFQDESFDAVICIDVLVHILEKHNQQKVFQEVERILRPGGVFVFSFTSKRYMDSVSFLKSLVGRDSGRVGYCRYDALEEMKEHSDSAGLKIEKAVGREYLYLPSLVKYPSFLCCLDILGKTPLKEFGRVIFVKARKPI